jgi:hypothetical protein
MPHYFRKIFFTTVWTICAIIAGAFVLVVYILIANYYARSTAVDLDSWLLLRHHKLSFAFDSLACVGLPSLVLILGLYGVLPGTRNETLKAANVEDHSRPSVKGNWHGLLSIFWMWCIYIIIHYSIKPSHLTFGLAWLLLFALVVAQLSIGFVLAHIGLGCGNFAGRFCAAFAIVLFIWFLCFGLVPLMVSLW